MTFLRSSDIERVTRARQWVRGTRCEFRSEAVQVPYLTPETDVYCSTRRMERWVECMVKILVSGEGDPFAVQPSEPYVPGTCARSPS